MDENYGFYVFMSIGLNVFLTIWLHVGGNGKSHSGNQGMIPNGFSLFCIANAPISLGIKVTELLCCRFAKSLSY